MISYTSVYTIHIYNKIITLIYSYIWYYLIAFFLRKALKYKYLIVFVIVLYGCSTQKNTTTTRAYHNLTSHYNVYFNGLESFRKGIKKAETQKEDNFSQILPLFFYTDKNILQTLSPDMDRAAKKATKVITLHSITVKPEIKKGTQTPKQREFYNQKEFNKWMDENYLLLGESYIYKNEIGLASETFKFIISEFPNTDTKYNALIWLARCYNETGEYRQSERILILLIADEKMPQKLKGTFYTTYADFYIKQKNYEKAIPMLEKAIKSTRKKFYKIRYTYILAQIYQETGNMEKAAENYKRVIAMNPPYEMTFNAKINLAASFDVKAGDGKEIHSLLRKMLKDDKNIEFQDQIYYALGKIALKENKIDDAIDFFKLSTSKSSKNLNQKGITYLTLANLFYDRQEYVMAKLYYDSTLLNLDQGNENYSDIRIKGGSLSNLVNNISVYQLEDSVQNLAKMTDAERKSVIDKIIARVIEKEQEEMRKSQLEKMDTQYGLMNQLAYKTNNSAVKTGKWYFYNTNAKSFGQPEFRMIWGNRKLEDNWRRKNKQTIEVFETSETKETSETVTAKEDKKIQDNKSPDYYMKNIPLTDSAMEISHNRLKEALFNMGIIYDEELNDQNNAIKSYEELVRRYPDDKLALLSYYNLYEIFNKKKDDLKAQQYKTLLVKKFPDSPLAQMLSNPAYIQQLQDRDKKVNSYYEETYSKYKSGDYNGVLSNVEYFLTNYSESTLMSKFKLLKALSVGKLYGMEKMKIELEEIVKNYPKNETGIYAKELINYIYSLSPETKIADITQQAEQIYQVDTSGTFYLIISISTKADIKQINFNLINFNLDNYNNFNLGLDTEEFGDKVLIKVSTFTSVSIARNYMDSLLKNTEIFKGYDVKQIQVFLISETNLEKLRQDKDISKYYLFYEKFY